MSDEAERSVFARAYELLESDFQPDLFLGGLFYQATLSAQLRLTNGQPTLFRDKKNRKGGEFYTPRWVVDLCVEKLVAGSRSAETAGGSRSAGVPPAFPRSNLRVIDPGVGTGNFLIGVFERLAAIECRLDGGDPAVLQFIQNGLHGRDTDGKAIAIARLLILLCARKFLPKDQQELQIALPQLWNGICKNIYVCDSLVEVQTESFDVVVGNPPYLSFGARNQPKLPPNWSKFLRSTYPDSAEYKIRLHSIFQDISLRLVRDGGQIILLVPDAYLNGCYYEKLRRLLLKKARIVSLTELPEATFDDATVGFWCIAHYEKANQPPASYRVSLERILRVGAKECRPDAGAPTQQYTVELEHMLSADRARLQMFFNDFDCNLFKRLRQCTPLSSVMRGHTGIRALAGQATIVSAHPKDGLHWKSGIISGSEVLPFQVEWGGHYLNVNPQKLFGGGHDASIIEKPKILMRQTADKLIAAVDTSGLYHLNNVHSFAPTVLQLRIEKLYFIAGLINSSLWRYVYQLKSREVGRVLAQIDIEMVEAMPLPQPFADARLWAQTEGSVCENVVANLARLLHENRSSITLSKDKRVCRRCAFKIMDRCIDQLYDISEADSDQIERSLGVAPTVGQNIASSDALCTHDIAKLLEFIKELPFSKVLANVQNA